MTVDNPHRTAVAARVAAARQRLRDTRTVPAGAGTGPAVSGDLPTRPVDGRLELPGFDGPVDVLTDAAGVPHVFASCRDDLYRAQGFLHHAERCWQIELNSRTCRGELAAIAGAAALASDVTFRRLGFPEVVEAQVRRAGRAVRHVFECYAQGARAAAAVVPTTAEHRLLGVAPRVPDGRGALRDAIAISLLTGFAQQRDWLHGLLRLVLDARQPWPAQAPPPDTVLLALAGRLGAVPTEPAGAGSNAWAIPAPDGAIVAGDPHLGASSPGPLMALHLHAPELQVAGASVPGVPDLLFGHNGYVAWATTAAPVRTTVLVLERLHPNRDRVDRRRGTAEVEVGHHLVEVCGGQAEKLVARRTDRGHLLDLDLPAGRPDRVYDVALMTALAERPYDQATLAGLATSRTAAELARVAAGWRGAPCTVVYGDRDGATGLVGAGTRAGPGEVLEFGWADPAPASGPEDAGDPALGDPLVVSANNRPPGETGPDHWEVPLRAARARRLLEARPARVAHSVRAQLDVRSMLADRLLDRLIGGVDGLIPEPAQRSLDGLARWSRQMHRDIPEPALFAGWLTELVPAAVAGRQPAAVARLFLQSTAWLTEWGFELVTSWLADRLTSPAGRAELAEAFCRAHAALGPDPVTWGQTHTVRYRHRLAGRMPEPAFGMPGFDDTLCRGGGNPEPSCGPAFRMVIDLGRVDESVWAFPIGNSGVPTSPHAADQVESWARGAYHRMPFSPEAVRKACVHRLSLGPPPAPSDPRTDEEAESCPAPS